MSFIDTLGLIDWLIIIVAFLSLSFWAYTTLFYEQLKQGMVYEGTFYLRQYTHGFLIFSMLNWVIFAIGMILLFGLKIGIIITLVLSLGGMAFIAGITTNRLYKLIGLKADISMMFLCLLVWVQVALLAVNIFI